VKEHSGTVARVLKADLCSGCGLCAGISGSAIVMGMAAPGYARPLQRQPVSPSIDAKIAASCPGQVVAPWPKEAERHPVWGPWRQTLEGAATDPAIRFAGASGGALSALLIHALNTGLVDRVLHVEADPSHPLGNKMRWSTNAAQILAGAGSRYAASSPLAGIDCALAEGGRFAFVGKPCDVSALRRLSRHDPRVAAHVPLMLSFFCGGMPSEDGARRIVAAMGLDARQLQSFRYRGQGWPGLTVATTAEGGRAEMPYSESWGAHLSREVQFRCKICPDAVGGTADIACADAWHGDDAGYPLFEEEDGRSLIAARTATGEALLRSAQAAGVVDASPLPISDISRMQPAQAQRKRMVAARVLATRLLGQATPRMRDLDVMRAARRGRLYDLTHNFLGTLRRVWQRRWRRTWAGMHR
jgi:coenzyme F420 hydrogenase subunit beta